MLEDLRINSKAYLPHQTHHHGLLLLSLFCLAHPSIVFYKVKLNLEGNSSQPKLLIFIQ